MKSKSFSNWQGTWKEGKGTLSTQTDTLKEAPYSFSSRFEGTPGGNPEELLGVALAGCFNQAIANNFGMNKLEAESIQTVVEIDLAYGEDSPSPAIKTVHITVAAKVPNATEEVFQQCAKRASTNCSIAKILKLECSLTATLLS